MAKPSSTTTVRTHKSSKTQDPSARPSSTRAHKTPKTQDSSTRPSASAAELELRYQRQLADATRYMERVAVADLTPMQRWQMEGPEQRSWDGVASYRTASETRFRVEYGRVHGADADGVVGEGDELWSLVANDGRERCWDGEQR